MYMRPPNTYIHIRVREIVVFVNKQLEVMILNEKLLERKLRKGIKKLGGLALKFVPLYFVGMPDRLILMPGARVYWVEVKSTGEKLRAIQETRERQLKKLGFKVFKMDCQEDLNYILKEVQK